jgi:anti-sigma factor RsiW
MSDQWTDRLSAYIDGELDDRERERLEAHLSGCDACRGTVADLRLIVARAAALEAVPPARDLWTGIRDRIGGDVRVLPIATAARPPRIRRFTLSLPQLAAAAIVIAFLSGGSVWLALHGGEPVEPAFVVAPPAADAAPAGATGAQFVGAQYDVAIDQLERELAEARDRLDATTVAVIEHNLEVIDAAIAEARRALADDPANPYLNRHLDNTLQKKIEVLRRVTTIGRGRT